MKNFAFIETAGYIAPYHLEIIKVTGNELVALKNKIDSENKKRKYDVI